MSLVPVEAGGFLRCEVIGSSGAQVIDQMRKTLLQRLDGGVFVIGPARPFQKSKQQHPGSALLADAQADRA